MRRKAGAIGLEKHHHRRFVGSMRRCVVVLKGTALKNERRGRMNGLQYACAVSCPRVSAPDGYIHNLRRRYVPPPHKG
jgi:hypothetical protein